MRKPQGCKGRSEESTAPEAERGHVEKLSCLHPVALPLKLMKVPNLLQTRHVFGAGTIIHPTVFRSILCGPQWLVARDSLCHQLFLCI